MHGETMNFSYLFPKIVKFMR